MKGFTYILGAFLAMVALVTGAALPEESRLDTRTVTESQAMSIARLQGGCMSLDIVPRRVDRAHQINFQWIITKEGRSDWNPNLNVHVLINAQTTEIDRYLTVKITNRNQRFRNAVILSRYATDSNTGPIQDQIRIPVGDFSRFSSFFSTLVNAAFSIGGIETAAVARAVGVLVPHNDEELLSAQANGSKGAAASPWVIAITHANIKVLPSIINAVILSSATNAMTLNGSRHLFALSKNRQTPIVFQKSNKK
ncbi:hypothetical protein H9Q69_011443 [Fusarium xylarioides]|nr:hypothetical protein H9Q69_011443 [Fusarium xylarioides]